MLVASGGYLHFGELAIFEMSRNLGSTFHRNGSWDRLEEQSEGKQVWHTITAVFQAATIVSEMQLISGTQQL